MRDPHAEGVDVILSTGSPGETEAAGRELGAILKSRDVVYLIGPLGAGKTTFVRGIHQGMTCGGRVRSPSFLTLIEYAGPVPLYHFDLYRYEVAGEGFLEEFAEWLESEGVAVVEWADRLDPGYEIDHIEVRFEDFVLKQEETLARLEPFLGMELARIPVRTDPVGRWRIDDKDDSTGPNCFDFFHRGICEYGYEFATAQC